MTAPRLDGDCLAEREAFEAWLITQGWMRILHLNRSKATGAYSRSALNDAWGVWQARAALSASKQGGKAEGGTPQAAGAIDAREQEAMRMLWDDQQPEEKAHYLSVVSRGQALALHKPTSEIDRRDPLFWYRPCGDNLYEGPHHTNSADGKILRSEKPDEWKPLYAAAALASREEAPPAAGAAQALEADAARYRWLREQNWFNGPLCVLSDPKRVLTRGIGLGADCPFGSRLDAAIDAARAAQEVRG